MLSRVSSPRRSSLSLHLLRHFSIRVSSLRKGSLFAKLLRRDSSPNNCARAIYPFLQREGSFTPVDKQGRLGPVLDNVRQQDLEEDAGCNGIAKLSVKSQKKIKEVLCSDGAVKRSVADDRKTYYTDEKPHYRYYGDTQRFQSNQGSCADAQISQTETRKSHLHHTPATVCVQSEVIKEEGTVISNTETKEKDVEKNAASMHTHSSKSSAPSLARETCKQVKEKHAGFVEVHSVIIKHRKVTDQFLQDLYQKIDLVLAESALLTHVQALLKRRDFLSASPEKLAAVLKVLKAFFESSDKACEILVHNAEIISHPLELLEQKLQIWTEFQVDKETCHWLGTRSNMMSTKKLESFQRSLTFLKDMGLGAELRNSIIRKCYVSHIGEGTMQSSLNFFVSIGITGPRLLKLVKTRPRIFRASVTNNLMVKHNFLQQMGFSAEQFIAAMGHISQCSNQKIVLQYNLFIEELGFSREDAIRILKQQPSIFGRSHEDLKAKWHFLLHTLKRDISEAVQFPAYFSCSLKDRILPRFRVLEGLSLPKSPSLRCVLARSSLDFRIYFKIPDSVDCM